MKTYLTNELVSRSLAEAGVNDSVILAMTDDDVKLAGTALVAALVAGSEQNVVTIKDLKTGEVVALRSMVRWGKPGDATEKVFSFSFSNLATEGLFPFLGLATACMSLDFSLENIQDAVDGARTLWTSFSMLRSPDHDDELAVLQAFGKSKLARAKTDRGHPSNADIAANCKLDPTIIAAVLQKLESKNILKLVKWGNVEGRYEDDQNTWKVRV